MRNVPCSAIILHTHHDSHDLPWMAIYQDPMAKGPFIILALCYIALLHCTVITVSVHCGVARNLNLF